MILNAIVDGLGNPLYFQFPSGNIPASKVAMDVLSHVKLENRSVLGDNAYGTQTAPKMLVLCLTFWGWFNP